MINIAIVGTSVIVDIFMQAVSEHTHILASTIVSRTKERGVLYQEKYNIKYHYATIEEAISDIEDNTKKHIDAFYIASPNSLHYSQAKKALLARKHVLLEKPFTSTSAELDELFEIAKKQNVIVMEAIKTIYLPSFIELKEYIQNCEKIESGLISFCRKSRNYDAFLSGEHINMFSAEMSGGSLVDVGVYCLWAALELFGVPKSYKNISTTLLKSGVDISGEIFFEYEDFNLAIKHSKKEFDGTYIILNTKKGSIVMQEFLNATGFLDEYRDYHKPQQKSIMFYELDMFYSAITSQNREQYLNTFHTKSSTLMSIMEDCRHQAAVRFPADK